jgi:hypothetical protein
MEMSALPGFIPNGITENRLREWYALKHLGNYNFPPTNVAHNMAHANTSSFFDCLDQVDDATLSFMIHELGLYSLQELPDLQVMFGNTNRAKSFPQSQRRFPLRQ